MRAVIQCALLLAVAVCGCRADLAINDAPAADTHMTRFSFTTRSDEGHALVKGNLRLPWPIPDGHGVEGAWEARPVDDGPATHPDADPARIGPQIGSGTLLAERDGQEIRINLNPQMSDNNVTLQGAIDGDALRGRWDYSTFIGSTAGGEFEAHRQP